NIEIYSHSVTFNVHAYFLKSYVGILICADLVLQSWSNMFDSSQEDIGLEHVIRVCAELGIECIDYDPAKRPTIRGIIDRLDEMERTHGYIETTNTSSAIHLLSHSLCITSSEVENKHSLGLSKFSK
uniref:Serine-threonine/tyrosine-protein kinase catalytic domain-containing protein n=1 Tax=Setaria italica TaxID=4555 RepID=K3ZLZ4_SETIT